MVERTLLAVTLAALAVACEKEGGEAIVPADAGVAIDAARARQVFIVDAISDQFVPALVNVPPGGIVRWVNFDGHDHTVTSGQSSNPVDNPGRLFDQLLAPGATFDFTFTTAGSLQYFDRVFEHAGMAGVVVVGP